MSNILWWIFRNVAKPVTGRVTNNVGEIQAAIYAIEKALEVGIKKLCLSTDSQFLINAITLWVNAWKRKDWRLKNGDPVKNVDDFKVLDELLHNDNLMVKWVSSENALLYYYDGGFNSFIFYVFLELRKSSQRHTR